MELTPGRPVAYRGVDGAIRAEADDVSASNTAEARIGDEDIARSIDRHGGGRDHARALGHDDLSGTAAYREEEHIGGGRSVALLQHIGVTRRVGGDGECGAQPSGMGESGGDSRAQQAQRPDADSAQLNTDQLAADGVSELQRGVAIAGAGWTEVDGHWSR